jgi:hypothetical protein
MATVAGDAGLAHSSPTTVNRNVPVGIYAPLIAQIVEARRTHIRSASGGINPTTIKAPDQVGNMSRTDG